MLQLDTFCPRSKETTIQTNRAVFNVYNETMVVVVVGVVCRPVSWYRAINHTRETERGGNRQVVTHRRPQQRGQRSVIGSPLAYYSMFPMDYIHNRSVIM